MLATDENLILEGRTCAPLQPVTFQSILHCQVRSHDAGIEVPDVLDSSSSFLQPFFRECRNGSKSIYTGNPDPNAAAVHRECRAVERGGAVRNYQGRGQGGIHQRGNPALPADGKTDRDAGAGNIGCRHIGYYPDAGMQHAALYQPLAENADGGDRPD